MARFRGGGQLTPILFAAMRARAGDSIGAISIALREQYPALTSGQVATAARAGVRSVQWAARLRNSGSIRAGQWHNIPVESEARRDTTTVRVRAWLRNVDTGAMTQIHMPVVMGKGFDTIDVEIAISMRIAELSEDNPRFRYQNLEAWSVTSVLRGRS